MITTFDEIINPLAENRQPDIDDAHTFIRKNLHNFDTLIETINKDHPIDLFSSLFQFLCESSQKRKTLLLPVDFWLRQWDRYILEIEEKYEISMSQRERVYELSPLYQMPRLAQLDKKLDKAFLERIIPYLDHKSSILRGISKRYLTQIDNFFGKEEEILEALKRREIVEQKQKFLRITLPTTYVTDREAYHKTTNEQTISLDKKSLLQRILSKFI